jgi:hypothetical protein
MWSSPCGCRPGPGAGQAAQVRVRGQPALRAPVQRSAVQHAGHSPGGRRRDHALRPPAPLPAVDRRKPRLHRQGSRSRAERNHDRPGGGIDLSLVLDLITAFFLIRFIKRPFRFFGGFGFAVLAVGGLVTAWLVFARLFLGEALVDRPALILSSLMIVLGIQIISVGLIGEIITFSFTKEHKDYKVERIVD